MTNLVKAREGAIIDLEHVAAIEHDTSGFDSVSGRIKSVAIYLMGGSCVTVFETDPAYEHWVAYMDGRKTIEEKLAQEKLAQAKQIANDDFDPFLDELPHDLFSVFRSLPGHEQMTLQLQSDGRGDIRLHDQIITFWVDPADGISRLGDLRKGVVIETNEE